MTKLKVNEIFLSIQGEGARAGSLNIFVRLADCNLTCGFCDTEFVSYKELTLQELLAKLLEFLPCKNIIWTGGEPLLQLDEEAISFFRAKGYFQAVETNGTIRPPKGLDYIALSPKVAEHIIKKNFDGVKVNELRYAMHKGKLALPQPSIQADYYFISPIFDGDKMNTENLEHCLKLIKENPKWRISVQVHKLLKVI
jgi:organic radical activating enzyme